MRVEEQGYAKVKDVYAYLASFAPNNPIEQLFKRVTRQPSPGVVLRQLDMKRYGEEVATLTEILNDAWRDNWGFTPTTEAEDQTPGEFPCARSSIRSWSGSPRSTARRRASA